MRRNLSRGLLRGLVVIIIVLVSGLWVLVNPLPESLLPPPTPYVSPAPSETVPPSSPGQPTESPTEPAPQSDVSSSATPTHAPDQPTAPPTATPTITPIPIPSLTPTTEHVSGSSTSSGTTILHAPITYPDAVLAGRVEQHAYYSSVTGREERYRIYLPPDYDATDRRYPVLYLFHGWPYDDTHWDNLGIDEVVDSAIQAGTLPPLVIIMPNADPDGVYVNSSGGDLSFEGQIINDLMPQAETVHRIALDRSGRAIGGISRGGIWALEIGLRHPELFSAVGSHSPALSYNNAPSVYDPFTLVDNPGITALRIYLDAGDNDWALAETQRLHEALDARSIDNQFAVHPGGHADGLWAANLAEYLAFYAAAW